MSAMMSAMMNAMMSAIDEDVMIECYDEMMTVLF